MITSLGSLHSFPRSFTGLILRFYFLSVEMETVSVCFSMELLEFPAPPLLKNVMLVDIRQKNSFCWVLCLTKPVVNQMWHFGSIYVNSKTHDDKTIKAPIQGCNKPEKRKLETKTKTMKLLTNNNSSVALRNGGCASVTLLIIPYNQLVHALM